MDTNFKKDKTLSTLEQIRKSLIFANILINQVNNRTHLDMSYSSFLIFILLIQRKCWFSLTAQLCISQHILCTTTKPNHYMCSFLHGVKNKTLLQAFSFKLSIQINLYSPSLFKHLVFLGKIYRQTINKHATYKTESFRQLIKLNRILFFSLILCFFHSLENVFAQKVIGWQCTHPSSFNVTLALLYSFFFFFNVSPPTLTCSNRRQYKHSIIVENKQFMYMSESHSHPSIRKRMNDPTSTDNSWPKHKGGRMKHEGLNIHDWTWNKS